MRLASFVLATLLRLLIVVLTAAVILTGVTAARVAVAGRDVDVEDLPEADTVVVLGAAQYDGDPGPYLTARLEQALAVYQAGRAPTVTTVGGGAPGDRTTEAAAGREWLIARGVPADAVMAVETGGDTWESLQAMVPPFQARGWDSAIVVTDPWHTLRSTSMLSDLLPGAEIQGAPTATGPSRDSTEVAVRYTVRETVALQWYYARRTLGVLPEAGP